MIVSQQPFDDLKSAQPGPLASFDRVLGRCDPLLIEVPFSELCFSQVHRGPSRHSKKFQGIFVELYKNEVSISKS